MLDLAGFLVRPRLVGRRPSVRRTLAAALLSVALFPPVGFLAAFWSVLGGHLREDAGSSSRASLQAISTQARATLADEPRRTLPTALILAERGADPRELGEILRKIATPRPDIAWMAFLDAEGRVLAEYPPNEAEAGRLIAFRAPAKPGSTTFSGPFVDEARRMALIEARYAGGEMTAVVHLDLTGASGRLSLAALSPIDRLGAVDEGGRYVLCSEPSHLLAGESVPADFLTGGTVLAKDEGGRFFITAAAIPGTEWRAVYFRSATEVEALSWAFLARVAIFLAVAVAFALTIAVLVSRSVSLPLGALVARIERVARGDYASRISDDATPGFAAEFRGIADAFNAMAESIERRDREIQGSEERYRLLFQGNGAPALILDAADGAIRDANPAAVAYYGYGDGLASRGIGDIDADPPEGGTEALLERLRGAAEERRSGLPRRHRLASGEVRDVELYVGTIGLDEREYLHVVVFDVTERRLAEERTVAALEEKTLLLREVHHRVKNNLQIITSLLSIQERAGIHPEASVALREGQDRVQAMALAHELVYQVEDFASIDLSEYVERLAYGLADAYGVNRARVGLDLRRITLELDRSIPFGLAVTELATNAFKYAILSGGGSRVGFSLSASEDPAGNEIALAIEDDGPGMPEGSLDGGAGGRPGSIGTVLVRSLAAQLSGAATWAAAASGRGTRAELRFPATPASGRRRGR